MVQIALCESNRASAGGDDDVPTKLVCGLYDTIPRSLSKIIANKINNGKGMG